VVHSSIRLLQVGPAVRRFRCRPSPTADWRSAYQPSALASATAVALARLVAAAVFGGSTGAAAAATWVDKGPPAEDDVVNGANTHAPLVDAPQVSWDALT